MSYHHLERLPVVSEVGVASFGGRLSCRSEDRKIAGDVALRSTLDEHICQSGNISHQEVLLRVARQVQKCPVAISSPTGPKSEIGSENGDEDMPELVWDH